MGDAPRRDEEPSHVDAMSEESFTVEVPGRGEVTLPLRWSRTYLPSGVVHEVVNRLVTSTDTELEGRKVRSVRYETYDSTSEDPGRPEVTEIHLSWSPLGVRTSTLAVWTGPRDRETSSFEGAGSDERQLTRTVIRGDFQHTWTYFDEPQPDRCLRVKSYAWFQVDKDGREIMKREEVADGLVVHSPELGVAKAGGDVGRPANAKGKAARQAPGLRVDLIPDEGEAGKGGRPGKKDGRGAAGRVRKGRGRGDRVRA